MHELSCSTGGLVIASHNEIRDELLYLDQRTFTPASVHAETLIHQGSTRSEKEILHGSDKGKETRGNVMIQGLWDRQVEAIIDVKLGDADADSYKYEPMSALLAGWETIKNNKHGKHCNNQQKQDEMIGREALVVLAQLSRIMAEKMDESLSHVHGYINGQITIVVTRSYSCLIRGTRIPGPLRDREPDWGPESDWQLKLHTRLTSHTRPITHPHNP